MNRLLLALSATAIVACGCQDPFGPRDGKPGELSVAWRNSLGANSSTSDDWLLGIPAATNGQVFVEWRNNLVAVDAATGETQWTTKIKPYPNAASPNVIVRNGLVIVGDSDVKALDVKTGEVKWHFATDSFPRALATADEDTYYTGQWQFYPIVYALSLADGSLRWRVNVGRNWTYAGFVSGVAVSGDTLYAGVIHYQAANGYLQSGVVVALDRRTGTEFWRYETPVYHDVTSAPLVVGNMLVMDDLSGHGLFAIDRFNPASGEKWRVVSPGQGAGPTAQSVVSNGIVYAATGGGYAYAIDAATGRVVWQRQTKSSAFGVGVCRGAPYINTDVLLKLDANTGNQVGYLHADRGSYFSSGLISDNQRIYVLGPTGLTAALCP